VNNPLDVPLDQISEHTKSQMRVAGIDIGTVAEYAAAMLSGAEFPPVVLFHDGEAYWTGDGFHRVAAAREIGRDTIRAEVRDGGNREAVLLAAGANSTHGLRRTQADKRKAVETLLHDPEWSKWSDREIGKACAVDHKTVGKVRRELTGEIPSDKKVTYRDRHGNVSQMQTKAVPDKNTPILQRLLASASDADLIDECRRRGLEVADV
jgi:uncharacterized ParB-like nuclease family protein